MSSHLQTDNPVITININLKDNLGTRVPQPLSDLCQLKDFTFMKNNPMNTCTFNPMYEIFQANSVQQISMSRWELPKFSVVKLGMEQTHGTKNTINLNYPSVKKSIVSFLIYLFSWNICSSTIIDTFNRDTATCL